MIRLFLQLLLFSGLAACSTSSYRDGAGPSSLNVLLPTPVHPDGPTFLSLRTYGLNESGTITQMSVSIKGGRRDKPRGRIQKIDIDPGLAVRVANSLKNGQDRSSVYNFAHQVARKTYCRTGNISPNNGYRRISDPAAIQAMVAEYNRTGREVIPRGAPSTAVPAVWYRLDGRRPEWEVLLKCNSPNPYK